MGGGFVLPPVAYVPGQTARHPEDLFDAVKAGVRAGMSVEALAGSACWRAGWTCYAAGYFWEAHELFEPVWMTLPEGSRERQFAQAAIQLANAALKARMGRGAAVARLCELAQAHLRAAACAGDSMLGVSCGDLGRAISDLRRVGRAGPVKIAI